MLPKYDKYDSIQDNFNGHLNWQVASLEHWTEPNRSLTNKKLKENA